MRLGDVATVIANTPHVEQQVASQRNQQQTAPLQIAHESAKNDQVKDTEVDQDEKVTDRQIQDEQRRRREVVSRPNKKKKQQHENKDDQKKSKLSDSPDHQIDLLA